MPATSSCSKLVVWSRFAHPSRPFAAGKPVGIHMGTLDTTTFQALQPEVETVGAEYVDCAGVVDGVMVSARAWPVHPARMRAFIRLLRERAPVEEREAVPV